MTCPRSKVPACPGRTGSQESCLTPGVLLAVLSPLHCYQPWFFEKGLKQFKFAFAEDLAQHFTKMQTDVSF